MKVILLVAGLFFSLNSNAKYIELENSVWVFPAGNTFVSGIAVTPPRPLDKIVARLEDCSVTPSFNFLNLRYDGESLNTRILPSPNQKGVFRLAPHKKVASFSVHFKMDRRAECRFIAKGELGQDSQSLTYLGSLTAQKNIAKQYTLNLKDPQGEIQGGSVDAKQVMVEFPRYCADATVVSVSTESEGREDVAKEESNEKGDRDRLFRVFEDGTSSRLSAVTVEIGRRLERDCTFNLYSE